MSGARLSTALQALREGSTAETRREVLEALSESELIFPAAERKPRDRSVRLAFTHDEAGRPLVPGFTDERHFSMWLPSGGAYAKAAADGFLPTILAGPFVGLLLNPGSDLSARIDRRALELLASGELPSTADVGKEFVTRWTSEDG